MQLAPTDNRSREATLVIRRARLALERRALDEEVGAQKNSREKWADDVETYASGR
jgi:hypothetical protein